MSAVDFVSIDMEVALSGKLGKEGRHDMASMEVGRREVKKRILETWENRSMRA